MIPLFLCSSITHEQYAYSVDIVDHGCISI